MHKVGKLLLLQQHHLSLSHASQVFLIGAVFHTLRIESPPPVTSCVCTFESPEPPSASFLLELLSLHTHDLAARATLCHGVLKGSNTRCILSAECHSFGKPSAPLLISCKPELTKATRNTDAVWLQMIVYTKLEPVESPPSDHTRIEPSPLADASTRSTGLAQRPTHLACGPSKLLGAVNLDFPGDCSAARPNLYCLVL